MLSTLYAAVTSARRRAYDRRPARVRRLNRPVVSIGNIAVGGSGKTPAVAHIARLLLAAGERPAILTRGYRRRDRAEGVVVVSDGTRILADVARAGDEPMMLARALAGVGVFVGADRYLSGLLAERHFGCTVHLLDDGFQHVQLGRDVDIVLVRQEDFADRVIPAGRLREAPSVLSRADALVMASAGGPVAGADPRVGVVVGADARVGPSVGTDPRVGPSIGTDPRLPMFDARQQVMVDESHRTGEAFAVAGIARPERFFHALAASGVPIAGHAAFPDHHWYSRADLARIVASARAAHAVRVLTTEKDFVRLLPLRPFPMPVDAVRLELSIEPAAGFRDWLIGRLERSAARSAEAHA